MDEPWKHYVKCKKLDTKGHIWFNFIYMQLVKTLPVIQETHVWSLGWEDPLEKEMATYFSIVTWRIPWTGKSMEYKELDTIEQLTHMECAG